MKKRVFLKILVALAVLTSVLLTSVLGVSKAEYFKELSSPTLAIEAEPDLSFRYYLYDCVSADTPTEYTGEWGVYPASKSFKQKVVVGNKGNQSIANMIYDGSEWVSDGDTTNNYLGTNLIYQIQIPVDETGYYTLHFTVDFSMLKSDGTWTEENENFFSQSYDRAIGCEVLNASDGITFGRKNGDVVNKLDLYDRTNNKVYMTSSQSEQENQNIKLLSTDSLYQWKTMSPSKQETVNLAFKVEPEDVTQGYVLWMWDFSGLAGPREYELQFIDVSFEKNMDIPDSTTGLLNTNEPYFMFPQTSLVNNQFVLSPLGDGDDKTNDAYTGGAIRGVNSRGKVSYSKGRGTFATEATANSLAIQAESIMYGYGTGTIQDWLNKTYGNTYGNPISFRVPLKNVQYGKTYKVTFDFSIARQGTYDVAATGNANAMNRGRCTNEEYADYADFNKLLLDIDHWSTEDRYQNVFMSYLYSGSSVNRSTNDHKEKGLTQIDYNDKFYQDVPLTKYDEVAAEASVNAAQNAYTRAVDGTIYANLSKTTSTSVNDTYSISKIEGGAKSVTRNWFNAIQHTENNGQNKINWLTFYNTTFSFNIPEGQTGVDLNDLYWVWAIDAVVPQSYYRIRIDNVRIQEVVQYSSTINRDGLYISGTQIGVTTHATHYDETTDNGSGLRGMFVAFRGQNGTGQNWQSKGYVLDDLTTASQKIFQSESNIYAPIVDATKFNVTNHQIKLDGEAACVGGVSKYVFSIDGGVTWEDATFTGGNATLTSTLSGGVNQYVVGQTRYTSSMFTNDLWPTFAETTQLYKSDGGVFKAADMVNGGFGGGKLVVDLSKYKNQANLDVIIAAVPASNTDLRCEIIRIINYNQMDNYFSAVKNIVSDISVTVDGTTTPLNAYYYLDGGIKDSCENTESFSYMKGIRLSTNTTGNQVASYSLGTLLNHSYEDVRAVYTNVPVYTTISVTGYAIVESGTSEFYWSADAGRTWQPCSGDYGSAAFDSAPVDEKTTLGRAKAWMYGDSSLTYADIEDQVKSYDGNVANSFGTCLKANLSDYVGKTVDVIFGAKPTGSDVYCPVARVDNVAVYGANGTFYTQINEVAIDGTAITPKYSSLDSKVLNKVTENATSGAKAQWNLGYSAANAAEFSHTIFETYNVNIYQTRMYNNTENPVNNGSKITIKGYTACKGGASGGYQYTLDGGETWTPITSGSSATTLTSAQGTYAAQGESTLSQAANTAKGDYSSTALEITLPTDVSSGEVKTFLVVATGSDGRMFPVFGMKLKFN